jgi:NAD(P)-dependent dehydrogenase (short-subunit alcohol dehydrogenase family)
MTVRNVLLITGAGRGIGAATALLGASRGYAVCINYLSEERRADALAKQIAASGGRAIAVQADVSIETDVMRLFEGADRQLGPVSVLVNNAGILGPFGRLDQLEAGALARVIDVNLAGAMLCSREAVRRMSKRHGGSGGAIVNVSSVAATLGGGGEWLAHAATKGAINTFTVGLAREVAAEGIRVNAVSPGLIRTERHADAGLEERLQRLAQAMPMQRPGSPEEVAEAILWLASSDSPYTIGANIVVAGGR